MSSNTPEGKVKTAIKNMIKKDFPDAVVVTPMAGRFSQAGVSDFIVCYKGRFIALEIKAIGGKLSQLQSAFLDKVIVAGGLAAVCFNVEEARKVLQKCSKS